MDGTFYLDMTCAKGETCHMSKKPPKRSDKTNQPEGRRAREGNILQAASFREMKNGLDHATVRVREALNLPGRGFRQGHCLEAFLAYCLTRPHDQQAEMVRVGMDVVDEIQSRKVPGPPLDHDPTKAGSAGSVIAAKIVGTHESGVGRKTPSPKRQTAHGADRGAKRRAQSLLTEPLPAD
jgi:hypothetical protein